MRDDEGYDAHRVPGDIGPVEARTQHEPRDEAALGPLGGYARELKRLDQPAEHHRDDAGSQRRGHGAKDENAGVDERGLEHRAGVLCHGAVAQSPDQQAGDENHAGGDKGGQTPPNHGAMLGAGGNAARQSAWARRGAARAARQARPTTRRGNQPGWRRGEAGTAGAGPCARPASLCPYPKGRSRK